MDRLIDSVHLMERASRPRIRPIAVVATIAGVLLFIYTLQAAGPREILRQLRQIGAGAVVVLALSAIRMALRAKAWSLCVEDQIVTPKSFFRRTTRR